MIGIEHHPHCPRFHFFEDGDAEETVPPCACADCKSCQGSGIVIWNRFQAGDQTIEETEYCNTCEGIGRMLTKVLAVDYQKGYPT